jgi:hypothetical protein
VTAAIVVALAATGTVAHLATAGYVAARPTIGLAALAIAAAVTAYWRPHVAVATDRVVVANVLSTIEVPFARVAGVDTRWALELLLDNGRKVTAFAAPAPGASKARTIRRDELEGLHPDTYVDGSARVGDAPGTPSGDAAALVRAALSDWRATREAGGDAIRRSANVASIVAVALGLAAAVAGFLL